ncbi:MAG: response regulator [Gemmataceae bacterium]|nr:response regulator [Gemmataceae bacterium]
MLVLSRRADEKIVFPSIGVTVRLLKINGSVARIGIDAPPELRILRHEIEHTPPPPAPAAGPSPTHELCNRLSKLGLALHLFQRQREAGRRAEADATLARVFASLEALDRDAVTALVGGRPPTPAARPPRALLVEDDGNERELLAGLLGMNGCECATAADGLEAMDYLAAHDRPDVVLLDMLMPRCDGPTTLRAIRAEPRLAGLRVFCVSGTSPHEMGVPPGPAGIDGWFPKPLNPRTLWDAIRQCASSPAASN